MNVMWNNCQPFSCLSFTRSPALRAVQKDGLYNNTADIVNPDLSFEAVLLGLPDVTEATKSTTGLVKMGIDVFLGAVVTTYDASKVSQISLQCLSIGGDWRYCYCTVSPVGLFLVDVHV